jgi:hypothetical protein
VDEALGDFRAAMLRPEAPAPDLSALPEAAGLLWQATHAPGQQEVARELILADPLAALHAYRGRALVVSAANDAQVPGSDADRIFAALGSDVEKKTRLTVASANHVYKSETRVPSTISQGEILAGYADDDHALAEWVARERVRPTPSDDNAAIVVSPRELSMRRPVGVPAALVSVLAVIAIIATTATLATQGRSSPAAGLTGVVWLWTETTTVRDPVPFIVPAPSDYSVEFGGDRRFRAKADCTAAAGTFRVILPGRMGPSPGLAITPDPGDRAPCGEGWEQVTEREAARLNRHHRDRKPGAPQG